MGCTTCAISRDKEEMLARPFQPGGLTEARHNLIKTQARVAWEWDKLDIQDLDLANWIHALDELARATMVLQERMRRAEEGEIFLD